VYELMGIIIMVLMLRTQYHGNQLVIFSSIVLCYDGTYNAILFSV